MQAKELSEAEKKKSNPSETKPKKCEKKPQRWLKFRHKAVRNIVYCILYPYCRIKYGIRIERVREKRQYAILFNHQTTFDQFFVGAAFPGAIYYIATEDIFSIGFLSSLIRYLVAPIPIKKQTVDLKAVKTTLHVAREGGTIALAPEGNRTYSGKTVHINESIAPLIRRMKLPVALFRIEGGYGAQPRWSDRVRKGKMRAYVSRVIEPEEYASLSDGALYEIIKKELSVDETQTGGLYQSAHSAEYIERMVYICPFCGPASFRSRGDVVTCQKCGRNIRYLPTKELQGIECEFPFRFAADWYSYQEDYVNRLNPDDYLSQPIYRDTVKLSEVIVYKRKQRLMKNAPISLYGDRVVIDGKDGMTIPFGEALAFTVLGRNKLNVYFRKKVYQIAGDKRFNALKYVQFFHRYKNLHTGDGNGKFLGL